MMTKEHDLPATGFVRVNRIIAPHGPIPISRSSWYAGIAAGVYPAPVRLSPRVSAWKIEDIRALIAKLSTEQS